MMMGMTTTMRMGTRITEAGLAGIAVGQAGHSCLASGCLSPSERAQQKPGKP